jgi:Protein of unknown function (DUF3306)
MMVDEPRSPGFSLRRWSQRKLAARRGEPELRPDDRDAAPAAATTAAVPEARGETPVDAQRAAPVSPAPCAALPARADATTQVSLPPLESLTIDSDFSPFMQPGVDENVKRTALRKLLRDPRFNVMDGLDVYIDDYSKPSPLEPDLVRTLVQARYIFDPPKTRVTADGIVEDVPDEGDNVEDRPDVAVAGEAPAGVEVAGETSSASHIARMETIVSDRPSVADEPAPPAATVPGSNPLHPQ